MRLRPLLVVGLVFAGSCTQDSSITTFPEDLIIEPSARPSQPAQLTPGLQLIPDQYVVVLKEGVAVEGTTTDLANTRGFVPMQVWEHALPGFVARMGPEAAAALRNDPRVRLVEQDAIATIAASQSPVPSWGIDRIDQRNLPLNNTYNYSLTGAGVHAYIFDTGINFTHVDWTGRLGNSFDAFGGTAADCHGHGSHVAGTVGGTSYGVAKEVTLHAIRVLDCGGSGPYSGIISAINWVIANLQLPAVSNFSLSGGVYSPFDIALQNMVNAGVFTAVAAGNNGTFNYACSLSPAHNAFVMTTGGTRSTDGKYTLTNWGACVDIFAPGQSITSAWWTSPTASNTISGTSMATPHVAGAGALILQRSPGFTPPQVTSELLDQATVGVIGDGMTPNLLLYTGYLGAGADPVAAYDWGCNDPGPYDCWFDATPSHDPDGTIVRYQWMLGSKTYSENPTVHHTFPGPTAINLKLRVTDNDGRTDEVTKLIEVPTVNQPPVASFVWSCTGYVCTFDASGSTDDVGIVDYHWWAGATHVHSGTPVLNHTFKKDMSFTLNLEVCDGGGLCDTTSKPVEVVNCTEDSDNDRLLDCYETDTGIFVDEFDTGTDPQNPDTDDDAIPDGDEVLGTLNGLDLPGMGVNPLRKDILMEYDWFDDALECGPHSHRPTAAAVSEVTAAFANSPVLNPDGSFGVNFIHDYGQGGLFTGGNLIPDADGVLVGGVNSTEFKNHKVANINPNRHGYFHYTILPHFYNTNSRSSGQAELPGDDMIVSLYCANSDHNVAHTIMHEVGHNLLIRHGGFENTNWKPNYNSVMNYKYQFPGIDNDCTPPGNGILDYSVGARPFLNETNLAEPNGVCGTPPGWDWNDDGDVLDVGISVDINVDGYGNGDGVLGVLQDHDDWASLYFSGLADADIEIAFKEIISCVNPAPTGESQEGSEGLR